MRWPGENIAEQLEGQSCDCQRKAHLSALPANLQRTALAGTGRQRSADPARAVGEHKHEESRISRRDVRGRVDWSRHGEHDATGNDRCVSRSREVAEQPYGKRGRSAESDGRSGEGRHLNQRNYHHADPRRSEPVSPCLQQVSGRSREKHAAKRTDRVSRLKSSLPETLTAAVKAAISEWQSGGKMQ